MIQINESQIRFCLNTIQDVTDTGAGMELAPSMDIFSAGCVLIELFTDSPPFNFSNLLAYRAGEYSPDRVLDKIDDPHMKVGRLV